jgi:CHAT domain-containing protein
VNPARPCPDSALLAAFIEGELSAYERTAVISHLAECDQCRSVAVGVVGFQEVQALDRLWDAPPAPPVAPIPVRLTAARPWIPDKSRLAALIVASVAGLAALAVPVLLMQGSWFESPPVAALMDASRGSRPIEARVSGGFRYAPRPSGQIQPERPPRVQLVNAAARVRAQYDNEPDAASRRAVGVAALLVGDLDDAIVNLAVAASAAPEDAHTANDLAAAYYERAQRTDRPDDLPRALSAAQKAVTLAPELTESWFNRALIISALGLHSEARAAWQAFLDHDGSSEWAGEARTRLQALESGDRTRGWIELRARLEARPDAATADAAVRNFASHAREFLEIELFRRWVGAADGAAEPRVLQTMRVLADAFARETGDRFYTETVAGFQPGALDRASRSQLTSALGEFVEFMAVPASLSGRDAVARVTAIHARLARAGSPLALRAEIDLAAARYYAGDADTAGQLVQVKERARQAGYPNLIMRAAWVQGLVAFAVNDFALAQVAYEERLSLAAASHDIDQVVSTRILLANLHYVLGDAPLAWRYRIEAAQAIDDVFLPSLPVVLLLSAAGDASSNGNHAAAFVFESSLLTRDVPINAATAVQARAQHARTLFALGRSDEADRELDIARQMLNSSEDFNVKARVEADVLVAEAQMLTRRNPDGAAAAAERALATLSPEREPLRVARVHALLAQCLIAAGHHERADAAVRHGITALERYRDLATSDGQLPTNDPVWSLYDAGIEIALASADMGRAFSYAEKRRIRTSFERRQWGREVLSLDRLQRGLPPDTAVAVLNQLGDQLHVWIVRRDRVDRHRATIAVGRASSLVASHLQEMVLGTAKPNTSGELFDLIFKPVESSLATTPHLVIVADAPYNRIAFAGLWDRSAGQHFVERHGLVAAPSATGYAWAVNRSQARAIGGPRAAVIVEADAGSESTTPSPDRDSLRAVYQSATVRRGHDATPAGWFADAAAHDVVHVAARVMSNTDFPSWSRLVLSDAPSRKYSGAVFARDVADSAVLQARLVALEGRTPLSRADGDGALGFVGALLVAGVPNVVGAIAGVDAARVERTWLDFHRQYATGLTAAESLRQAQLSALRESNGRPGPWAMLTVFGSTQ